MYYVIIYLFATLLSESSELLFTEFWDVFNPIFCFVLAPNKDLAVSFQSFDWTRPMTGASLFRARRFCSHLAHYCGRPLAAIILSLACARDGVRTFLSGLTRSDHLIGTWFIIHRMAWLSRLNMLTWILWVVSSKRNHHWIQQTFSRRRGASRVVWYIEKI